MPELMTQPDLDAALIERTAKAIGRARILADYPPPEPTISEDGYALYWKQESPEYRDRFRRQAIAALRASKLLEQVAELEARITAARQEMEIRLGDGARDLADRLHRADRVLSKSLPEPEPISIKL